MRSIYRKIHLFDVDVGDGGPDRAGADRQPADRCRRRRTARLGRPIEQVLCGFARLEQQRRAGVARANLISNEGDSFEFGGSDGRTQLQPALRDGPPGWLQALKAPQGPATVIPDVLRLSERPLAPGAALASAGARPAPLPGMKGQALPAALVAQAPLARPFALG